MAKKKAPPPFAKKRGEEDGKDEKRKPKGKKPRSKGKASPGKTGTGSRRPSHGTRGGGKRPQGGAIRDMSQDMV